MDPESEQTTTYYLSTHLIIFSLNVPLIASGTSWYILSASADILALAIVVGTLIFTKKLSKKMLVSLNAINITVDCLTLLLTMVSLFDCAFQNETKSSNDLTLGQNICLPRYIFSAFAEAYVIGILLFSITWLLNMSQRLNEFMVESLLLVCIILTIYVCTLLVYMTSYIVASFEVVALCLCMALFFVEDQARIIVSGFTILAKTGAILFLMIDVLRLTDGEELVFETQLTRWLVLCGNISIIIFIITFLTIDIKHRQNTTTKPKPDGNSGAQYYPPSETEKVERFQYRIPDETGSARRRRP